MRIRKHFPKLLSISPQPPTSCPNTVPFQLIQPPPPPPPPFSAVDDSATATAAPSLSASFFRADGTCSPAETLCRLSQSPWDTPSPQHYYYHRHDDDHRPRQQEMVDENDGEEDRRVATAMDMGTDTDLFPSSACTVNSSRYRTQPKYHDVGRLEYNNSSSSKRENSNEQKQKQPHSVEKERNGATERKKIKKKKKMKATSTTTTNNITTTNEINSITKDGIAIWVEKVPEKENNSTTTTAATAIAICKKTDGKGWHCKREAKHPHSLCSYHLSQIRSYYHGGARPHQRRRHSSAEKKKNCAVLPKKENKNKWKSTNKVEEPEFYYYYSGFGPWRGKRRALPTGGERKDCKDVDGSATNITADASFATATLASSDDLDPESIDDVEDDSYDDVCPVRRRMGRKPIKARSLKSLL